MSPAPSAVPAGRQGGNHHVRHGHHPAHTGTQNVRSYAMLQLLLGNIGIAGGGINALRGE